jgi:hypothetical protein
VSVHVRETLLSMNGIHKRVSTLTAVFAAVCLMLTAGVFRPVSAGYLYCTSDSNVEPTIAEIVNNIVPVRDMLPQGSSLKSGQRSAADADSLGNMHEHLLDASKHSIEVIGRLPVPIRSMFANGLYTIDLTNTHTDISFNDVYLIQQNYVSIGFICTSSLVPQMVKNVLCVCVDGDDISNSRLTNRERQSILSALSRDHTSSEYPQAELKTPNQLSTHWCVSSAPVCTSRNMNDYCRVFVDPIRPSCIYIRHEANVLQTQVDPFDVDEADPFSDPTSSQRDKELVQFNLSSYTVGEYVNKWMANPVRTTVPNDADEPEPTRNNNANARTPRNSRHVKQKQSTNIIDTELMRKQAHAMRRSSLHTLNIMVSLLGKIPLYICSAALGFSLIYISEDLSSNSLFQYSLTAVFGILLFVCVFAYALYTTTLNVTRQASIPIVSSLLAPFLGWFALAPLAYAAFRNMVYYAVLNFW